MVEVREAQEAERERRNSPPAYSSDGGHELVGRVTHREQAGYDGTGTDAEHHVEIVDAAVGQAVIEALERTHLEVDSRDPAARRANGGLPDSPRLRQVDTVREDARPELGVVRPG